MHELNLQNNLILIHSVIDSKVNCANEKYECFYILSTFGLSNESDQNESKKFVYDQTLLGSSGSFCGVTFCEIVSRL